MGGTDHDDRSSDDDDEIDPVRDGPPQDENGIPTRLTNPEARQRQRDARQRGDAVREDRERPNQLPLAPLDSRLVLVADEVKCAEAAVDQSARDEGAKRREQTG